MSHTTGKTTGPNTQPPRFGAGGLTVSAARMLLARTRDYARRATRHVGLYFAWEEIAHAAIATALERAPSFTGANGASLLTFLERRSRGAVLDACRAELERRRREGALANAVRAHHLGRPSIPEPTDPEARERATRHAAAAVTIVWSNSLARSVAPWEDAVIEEEERIDRELIVRAAVASLEPKSRVLVQLVLVEEWSVSDAAPEVGLTYAEAHYRLRKAKDVLGRRMKTLDRGR